MAPTGVTSTAATTSTAFPAVQPSSSEFAGDEFSNNLFSDLAPLLTLFGEQVTMQFLSMSMGWADNILLGVGPLGILTTVVSAIRVGGVRRLKALVGRARESQAIAEQEILSSTSNNVCELWSGSDIVRQLGKSKTKEFVIFSPKETDTNESNLPEDISEGKSGIQMCTLRKSVSNNGSGVQVGDLQESVSRGWLKEATDKPRQRPLVEEELEEFVKQSPNIALNVDQAISSNMTLWTWSIIGTILQCVALIVPALATYHWQWQKGDTAIVAYAYPCFLAGSIAVTVGLVLCSYVIEATTIERTFVPCDFGDGKKDVKVFRVQMACTVGDQEFPPFLILNPEDNRSIRTSRLLPNFDEDDSTQTSSLLPDSNEDEPIQTSRHQHSVQRNLSKLAAFSSLVTVSGFICQFVGLRGLHWSATIIQLGVTVFMTGVRSWVRRGLAHPPKAIKLDSDNLDRIALSVGERCIADRWDIDFHGSTSWEIATGGYVYFALNETTREEHMLETLPHEISCLQPSDSDDSDPDGDATGRFPRVYPDTDPRIAIRNKIQVWSSEDPLFSLAKSLADAIEQTMEIVTTKTKGEVLTKPIEDVLSWEHTLVSRQPRTSASSRGDQEPATYEENTLQLSCIQNRQHDDQWKAPKDLHAVLSLWVYTLNDRNTSDLVAAERYARGGLVGVPMQQREQYVRLLGLCANFEPKVLEQLPNWSAKVILAPPLPNGKTHYWDFVQRRIACWPIFGLTTLTNRLTATELSRSMEDYAFLRESTFGFAGVEDRTFEGYPNETCLAIISNQSMATQCALEIFSGFIDAIAQQTKKIGGQTHEYESRDEYDRKSTRNTNSFLNRIAQTLVTTGIVKDIHEANVIVIPPFARRGLLPTGIGQVDLWEESYPNVQKAPTASSASRSQSVPIEAGNNIHPEDEY